MNFLHTLQYHYTCTKYFRPKDLKRKTYFYRVRNMYIMVRHILQQSKYTLNSNIMYTAFIAQCIAWCEPKPQITAKLFNDFSFRIISMLISTWSVHGNKVLICNNIFCKLFGLPINHIVLLLSSQSYKSFCITFYSRSATFLAYNMDMPHQLEIITRSNQTSTKSS